MTSLCNAFALFRQVDGFLSKVVISNMSGGSPDALFDAVRQSVGGSKQLQDMGQVRTTACFPF